MQHSQLMRGCWVDVGSDSDIPVILYGGTVTCHLLWLVNHTLTQYLALYVHLLTIQGQFFSIDGVLGFLFSNTGSWP
jgi:hypothetical protein